MEERQITNIKYLVVKSFHHNVSTQYDIIISFTGTWSHLGLSWVRLWRPWRPWRPPSHSSQELTSILMELGLLLVINLDKYFLQQMRISSENMSK